MVDLLLLVQSGYTPMASITSLRSDSSAKTMKEPAT